MLGYKAKVKKAEFKLSGEVDEVIWVSFILGAASMFFEIIIAIPLGILAARKQYSGIDYFVTVLAMICISLPSFFLATVLKLVFGVYLEWFEIAGLTSARTFTRSRLMQKH